MIECKFRRLRREELEEVRDSFVRFLSTNGIDAPSWQKMKVESPDQADKFIVQFSDMVFSGVIDRVKFLVERNSKDIRSYQCGPDKMIMRGLLVEGDTSLELSNSDISPEEIMNTLRKDGAKVKIFSAERPYIDQGRQKDIFLMMERGALIDDENLFKVLENLEK